MTAEEWAAANFKIAVSKVTVASPPVVEFSVTEPLDELRRLLTLHRAYELMNHGDEAVAAGKMDEALRFYSAAQSKVPGNDEFVFWPAVALVGNQRVDEALKLFARVFRMKPAWMLLVPRLPGVGQLPTTPGLVEKILATGPKYGRSSAPGR